MVAKRRLRVAVFTTSYPRHQDDFAGRFVSDAVAHLRRVGVAVDVVPNGIAVPDRAGEEAEPLEVFFTGRLSPEKGVRELAAATEGMNLVVTGDGPLRDLVPTRGFVSREELAECFARAAVVVCPS